MPTVAELAQQELDKRYSLQGRTQLSPRVQTMQNARPTVRSALSNLMRDAVDATGLGGGYRQGLLNAAGGVETAVDFLPVVGDVLGLEDASRAYGQGDMVGAGINMLGAVPIVGDVAAKGVKSALRGLDMNPEARMQRAQDQGFLPETYYHGTNEDFAAFDPSRAEGSRSGSIFMTDNPAVASTYATVANKKNVMPLRIRPARPVQIYADGANWNKLTGDTIVELPARIAPPSESERLLSQLKKEGIPPRKQVEGSRTTLRELFPESFSGFEGNYMNTNDLSNFAQYEGADSIIFHDIIDIGPSAKKEPDAFKPSKNAVIFEPEKIRSINAEFDPAKADSADLLSSVGTASALRGIV